MYCVIDMYPIAVAVAICGRGYVALFGCGAITKSRFGAIWIQSDPSESNLVANSFVDVVLL